jgi:hypothetical protein
MAFWNNRSKAPDERARQQIRDLSKALVKSVRQVDKSYPNQAASDRIQQQYQRQVAEVLQLPPAKQSQKNLPKTSPEKCRIAHSICRLRNL